MGHADVKTAMGYVPLSCHSAAKEMTEAIRQIAGMTDVLGTPRYPVLHSLE
jgi:hypothetical protein